MDKIRILCYGDSNTWGYISGSDHQRYDENTRWTKLLSQMLGNNYEIIEEGLSGRTLISNDPRPGKEGRSGYQYLIPCLASHDPIDLVILMLGTNELKTTYNTTLGEISNIIEVNFVQTIIKYKSKITKTTPKLILIAPPLINETVDEKTKTLFLNGTEKSKHFNEIYEKVAKANNCIFINNEGLETGIDGIHLKKSSHKLLANKIYNEIKNIYK